MLKPKRPDCILFDLDDTLYETKYCHLAGLEAALKYYSIQFKIPLSDCLDKYTQSQKVIKLSLGSTAASHSRMLYFQTMCECNHNSFWIRHCLKMEELYWDFYLQKMKCFNGVLKLFKEIRENSITVGIVTDLTARIQLKKLQVLGIADFVNCVVTSEESGLDKPNFNCFSLIDTKLNAENKALRYWMVGDHPLKDLKGAKVELGATTFLIGSSADDDSPHIDIILREPAQVLDYLIG